MSRVAWASLVAFALLAACRGERAAPAEPSRVVRLPPPPPRPTGAVARGSELRVGDIRWRVLTVGTPGVASRGGRRLAWVELEATNEGRAGRVLALRPDALDGEGHVIAPREPDAAETPVADVGIERAPLAPGARRVVWAVYEMPGRSAVRGFHLPGFTASEGTRDLLLPASQETGERPPRGRQRRPRRRGAPGGAAG